MKRALIVANTWGFISDFLVNDVYLLKNMGFELDIAGTSKDTLNKTSAFFDKYNLHPYDIDFTYKTIEPKALIRAYRQVQKILKENYYYIIHCHTPIVAAIVRECAKKYRIKGTKVVYTSHGFPFYEGAKGKKAILYKAIENHYSRYTDAILTICNEDYNIAKSMHCNNVYKMNGVGVDLTRFDKSSLIRNGFNRNYYRKQLGFNHDDKVLLSIGELNTNKNHQIVIKALGNLNEERIVYAICGRELTEIGKKNELLQLAKECNVDIRFLGFRKDIPEVCLCADIGAIPSFKEGLGLSGIEMLAMGIPIVGSNRQGIKDYVIDGLTGYLADPESVTSFESAIQKTLLLKDNIETSENCRKIASQYGCDQAEMIIKKVYDEVLF